MLLKKQINKMICIIRIRGRVGINKDINETLNRLRLRKKYSCVIIKPKKEQLGMIKKIKDFVAFGEISDEMFEKLIEARGQIVDKDKKIDAINIINEIKKGKKYQELNLKPFFRLHSPRKGINAKLHFPKGVLMEYPLSPTRFGQKIQHQRQNTNLMPFRCDTSRRSAYASRVAPHRIGETIADS